MIFLFFRYSIKCVGDADYAEHFHRQPGGVGHLVVRLHNAPHHGGPHHKVLDTWARSGGLITKYWTFNHKVQDTWARSGGLITKYWTFNHKVLDTRARSGGLTKKYRKYGQTSEVNYKVLDIWVQIKWVNYKVLDTLARSGAWVNYTVLDSGHCSHITVGGLTTNYYTLGQAPGVDY
jgi:hypothetical protein